MLGTQILPQFVKLHETYIDDIENSVGDSRNLAALITKSFITGIRKVPEALGKLRTSFNLLNQLQSKDNLYYHIVALEILTKEMVGVLKREVCQRVSSADVAHLSYLERSCYCLTLSSENPFSDNQTC
jgi:hypothetical protein